MKIGLLVGSLRKESWNKKVAQVVQKLFPEDIEVNMIDISYLPFYNEDLDGENPIDEYKKIREEIGKYDGYMFFTPEYNRSYAPAIKNVIDIISKNPTGNLWNGKPAAVFSASIGQYGGMGANFALRQPLVCVNLIPMQRPEVYLATIDKLFDGNGNIDKNTEVYLQTAVNEFIEHAKKIIG